MSERSSLQPPAAVFQARLVPGDWPFEAPDNVPLLLAAEAAGLALPSSCRNGTCRTCVCRLHGGQVRYRIEWPGLSAEEKAEGLILACVAYPVSDVVLQAGPE
ncbi:MAG TPA: 2Fe-2S iron-sulfur cluster-binding protein [Burkholderiaceae bacterium]|nr:2Fe-2S iron-sulfur cluster-binding protein [Burkholderiaceae bacterium]